MCPANVLVSRSRSEIADFDRTRPRRRGVRAPATSRDTRRTWRPAGRRRANRRRADLFRRRRPLGDARASPAVCTLEPVATLRALVAGEVPQITVGPSSPTRGTRSAERSRVIRPSAGRPRANDAALDASGRALGACDGGSRRADEAHHQLARREEPPARKKADASGERLIFGDVGLTNAHRTSGRRVPVPPRTRL